MENLNNKFHAACFVNGEKAYDWDLSAANRSEAEIASYDHCQVISGGETNISVTIDELK